MKRRRETRSRRSIRLAQRLQAAAPALPAGHGGHSWIHRCSSVRRIWRWPPPWKRRWFITQAINQHVRPPLHTAHAPNCLPCHPGYPSCGLSDATAADTVMIHWSESPWVWRWTALCAAQPGKPGRFNIKHSFQHKSKENRTRFSVWTCDRSLMFSLTSLKLLYLRPKTTCEKKKFHGERNLLSCRSITQLNTTNDH